MIILFISKGCNSCERILNQLTDSWKSKILILEIKYDKELNIYRAYSLQGEAFGEEAPVSTIPTLYFLDEEVVYVGYESILKRLSNE